LFSGDRRTARCYGAVPQVEDLDDEKGKLAREIDEAARIVLFG
jgi:hypothetical protein